MTRDLAPGIYLDSHLSPPTQVKWKPTDVERKPAPTIAFVRKQ